MVRAGDVVELYAERTEELAQIFGFSGSDADVTVSRAASTMAAVDVPALRRSLRLPLAHRIEAVANRKREDRGDRTWKI